MVIVQNVILVIVLLVAKVVSVTVQRVHSVMTVQNVILVIVQYVAILMTSHVVNVRSVVKIVRAVNLTTN
jgi:hypothetical protein